MWHSCDDDDDDDDDNLLIYINPLGVINHIAICLVCLPLTMLLPALMQRYDDTGLYKQDEAFVCFSGCAFERSFSTQTSAQRLRYGNVFDCKKRAHT